MTDDSDGLHQGNVLDARTAQVADGRTAQVVAPPNARRDFRPIVEKLALPLILIALILLFSAILPTFRTIDNFQGMINSQSIILLLAMTATIALRTGLFDLSIAAVMLAGGATMVMLADSGMNLLLAVLITLAGGLVVGSIHAFLVVRIGVDALIVTLGTLTALGGYTYFVTGSRIVAGLPDIVIEAARFEVLGFPAATWYGWILAVLIWYVFERTPLGRHMLFIGGNPDAARLAGIRVERIRQSVFLVSALLAVVIGMVLVGQLGAVDPGIGGQFLLPPFAAAFLGSTAITPGRFNSIGTVFGVYLGVTAITGLQLLGVASWVGAVFNGLALVVAVTLSALASRKR